MTFRGGSVKSQSRVEIVNFLGAGAVWAGLGELNNQGRGLPAFLLNRTLGRPEWPVPRPALCQLSASNSANLIRNGPGKKKTPLVGVIGKKPSHTYWKLWERSASRSAAKPLKDTVCLSQKPLKA